MAHDTNIAMVRTLMNFSWQLPGYSRGNIPPGSSLVLERWRNAKSGERYLRVYFQAQGLDDLRRLQTPDAQHPMLRQEWRQPGCRQTDVGTLCPFQAAITALGQRIDRSSAPAVAWSCRSGAVFVRARENLFSRPGTTSVIRCPAQTPRRRPAPG